MLNAFWWLLTAEAIGLAAFPLAYYLFPRLQDRGYSVSKPLGILLIGYASWILSQAHILPNVQLSIVGLLLVMGAFSGWYVRSRLQEFLGFVRREWKVILTVEVIFLVLFIVWAVYRAYDPSITHTEKPMDFALLNASTMTYFGPPEDPWLSGESVSYYYFGHWMMGATTKLTGISTSISYNLALALIPALAGVGVFGLVYNLVRSETHRLRYAIIGGITASVLLTLVANLEGVLEFMRANAMGSQGFWDWVRIDGLDGPASEATRGWRPDEFWWWWRSTRVINTFVDGQGIDYTIQEFPFFSFMLGDLHPHVLSIPFVVLFLAFCLNFLSGGLAGSNTKRMGEDVPVRVWSRLRVGRFVPVVAMGLSLGGLAFTNMWDLPIFAALFLGVAGLRAYAVGGGGVWTLIKGTVPIGTAVIGLAFLLFLPYHSSFSSQFSGIHPVVEATTRPVHFFMIWALFLVAVAPFVVGVFWRTTVKEDWGRVTALSLLIGFLPYLIWAYLHLQDGGSTGDLWGRFFHIFPLALLVSVGVYSALWLAGERASVGRIFAVILATLGLFLVMVPELLFVGDLFGTRMNTVFKFYYQAWIVLAVASGLALYFWGSLREKASGWARAALNLWAAVFIVLLAGSLYYPAAAAASKGGLFEGGATLDGLVYLTQSQPGEYEAIKFIKENFGRGSTVLEAVGEDYSEYGRVSASTGLPTVLGWAGHEHQWRGSSAAFEGRKGDVARIYQTQDVEEARNLLSRYDVDYVYVGHRERARYGEAGLDKFADFADKVFDRGGVRIYEVRQ